MFSAISFDHAELSSESQKIVTKIFVIEVCVYHLMTMDRSTHERFSQRLKGGLLLLAVVFGVLMLSGSPQISVADIEIANPTIVADPTNHAWDAY